MRRLRSLLVAVLLVAAPVAASAQDAPAGPKPEGAPGAVADPLGFTTEPTVEDVMDRLRALLGGFSPFAPAGPALVTDQAEIERGDVIVALPVQPRRVGRLRFPLVSERTMFRRAQTLMPAGTPVFYTRFHYTVTSGYGAIIQSTDYDAWCGVVRGDSARPTGYCALSSNGAMHAYGEVIGGSPYLPSSLSGPFNAAAIEVDEDPAVLSEFPRLFLTYTFVEFDNDDADVRRGVRVGPTGAVIETNNVSLRRETTGASNLKIGSGEIRIQRTGDRRRARIEVVTPPQAYNLEEEEAELRLLAAAYVARWRLTHGATAETPVPVTPAPPPEAAPAPATP
jgi:hypothetical protein